MYPISVRRAAATAATTATTRHAALRACDRPCAMCVCWRTLPRAAKRAATCGHHCWLKAARSLAHDGHLTAEHLAGWPHARCTQLHVLTR
eukprot:4027663-Prymnesium_polylepis.1